MIEADRLLEIAEDGVRRTLDLGADAAEVFAAGTRSVDVDLQKGDIHTATTSEEATFGIRVLRNGGMGFATVNGRDRLQQACEEAVAMAAMVPPDPHNGLREPDTPDPWEEEVDPGIRDLDVSALVDVAEAMLARVREKDSRVRVDSGGVGARVGAKALATSTGIRLAESGSAAGGSLFGMAVDGEEVGSFDVEGHQVTHLDGLRPCLDAAVDRFVTKTTGALGAGPGESFRGTVVFSPEVVAGFVLGNLTSILSGKAVRTGRSPLGDRLGRAVASTALTLKDDPRRPRGPASTGFDREGTTTRRMALLERGVLKAFLYDVYEGRAAGAASTGHALGGASGPPSIGPRNLVLEAGEIPLATLCGEAGRVVVVTRFSGSANPVTGEFSGVVKGGFLIREGERSPIRETMISGNLYDVLKSVSGVSREVRDVGGTSQVPALRVEDVSVTAA